MNGLNIKVINEYVECKGIAVTATHTWPSLTLIFLSAYTHINMYTADVFKNIYMLFGKIFFTVIIS